MSCRQTENLKELSEFTGSMINRLKEQGNTGAEYTSSGIHIGDKIRELVNVKRSLDDGRLPADLTNKLEVKKNLLDMLLRRELKSRFTVKVMQDGKVTNKTKELVLEKASAANNEIRLTVKENGKSKEYKFIRGASVSAFGEDQIFISGFGDTTNKVYRKYNSAKGALGEGLSSKDVNEQVEQLIKMLEGKVLGSSADAKFDRAGYKEYKGYVHGDVDHMKNLLDFMNDSAKKKASKEQIQELKELFDQMHPSFFRNMNVYINENTKDTAGWSYLGRQDIYLGVNPKKRIGKTAAEVYAHEVIHTMIGWALEQKNNKADAIRRELNYVFKIAMDNTTWENFLEGDVDKASKAAIEQAKKEYDYVFKSKNANHEFIAYAMTNPKLKKHVETIKLKDKKDKTVWEKVSSVFSRLMDVVLGNYKFREADNNVQQQVHRLAFELAAINQNAEQEGVLTKTGNALYDIISRRDEALGDLLRDMQDKVFNKRDRLKPLPKDASEIQKLGYMNKLVFKAMNNDEYRKALGLWASEVIRAKPDGEIREFIRFFLTPDTYGRAMEFSGMQNNKIDMLRNSYINSISNRIKEAFKVPLEEEQDKALTRVLLDTNASNLLYKKGAERKTYNNRELREVLTDWKALEGRINTAKNKISKLAPERRNWLVGQAVGLGYFMATHQGHVAQLANAEAIVRGVGTNELHKIDKEMVELVREVASLTALKYTDSKDKKLVAELMKDEYDGVRVVTDTYEDFKANSRTKLFEKDPYHMMEGYSKEVFEDGIDMQIQPLSRRQEMEKLGYTFEGPLEIRKDLVQEKKLGVFVSSAYAKNERLQQAVSLGGFQSRGTSLKENAYMANPDTARTTFKRNKAAMDLKRKEIINAMEKGEFDVTKVEKGIMPILDARGNIVDYRNMMSKERKEKLLGQDVRASSVVPRTVSTLVDKQLREQQNEDVLELIKTDMKENWGEGKLGKDGLTEYRLIGPNVADPDMRELYYMLPESHKNFINSRQDKQMAVRRDLMKAVFGYKHIKLTDAAGIRLLPAVVRNIIDMFEGFWMDLVKIAKTNILMKMPLILISNILSNILYAINTVTSPFEIVGMYKNSFREVKAFMKAHKESIELGSEIGRLQASLTRGMQPEKKGRLVKEIEAKRNRLDRLKAEMEQNEVKELFDLGMYQAIIEDVNTNTLGENNRITEGMDKLLHKTPAYVKTPLQIAYLSKETKWYKFNQEVLQLSDLVARDVMNRKLKRMEQEQIEGKRNLPREYVQYKEEKGDKISRKKMLVGEERDEYLKWAKEARHSQLLDSFINYSRPNGNFEEYMNRMGFFMFTKYVKGIQRVILQAGTKYPLKTLTTLLGASLALDIDNIQDQSFLTKGFDYQGDFGVTNIFPVYSPIEQLMNVITPALVKEETYLGLV